MELTRLQCLTKVTLDRCPRVPSQSCTALMRSCENRVGDRGTGSDGSQGLVSPRLQPATSDLHRCPVRGMLLSPSSQMRKTKAHKFNLQGGTGWASQEADSWPVGDTVHPLTPRECPQDATHQVRTMASEDCPPSCPWYEPESARVPGEASAHQRGWDGPR